MEQKEKISNYIDRRDSIAYSLGDQPQAAVETIARRYVGENPQRPFIFSAFHKDGFLRKRDGRLDMNLREKFPEAARGQTAYASALLWMDQAETKVFEINCYGPTRLFVNGVLEFRSAVREDVNVKMSKQFSVELKRGWNSFVFRFMNTTSGFGCLFAPEEIRWNPLTFTGPFSQRMDSLGFAYSQLCPHSDLDQAPDWNLIGNEEKTGLHWYPSKLWREEVRLHSPLERIFGTVVGTYVIGWTSFEVEGDGNHRISISCDSKGITDVYVNQLLVLTADSQKASDLQEKADSRWRTELSLKPGRYQLLILAQCIDAGGFRADIELAEHFESDQLLPISFCQPVPVKGSSEPWFYAGPFTSSRRKENGHDKDSICPGEIEKMHRLLGRDSECTYWQLDEPNTWIRPCLQSDRFGRWNYPLGVTLYGLLMAGRELQQPDLVRYAVSHISQCALFYEYALWDLETYGYPELNNQICTMGMLDDCGSFASAMLEAFADVREEETRQQILFLAGQVANHMKARQERQPDGAFYRSCQGHFMENTLWADDLYMSTPFLIRYYQRTGEMEYLEDAAEQFLLFKKYLFRPDKKIMSHVYDFKYNTSTLVSWGRGNGWVLFSLSELLALLPKEHVRWKELVDFFRELSSGLIALQGSRGLWHQVLDELDSYEETSCTAMFIYGFSRGIRYGWLNDCDGAYRKAVRRAWKGLTEAAVDCQGNVYGVCRGSHYSFTSDYYKKELTARSNDTHGIGIVMLAGIEFSKLK